MDNLKASFEGVADWCEKHLEDKQGREIGMTFGAMLRAYGRLATLPSRLHGEQRTAKERQLNAKAEELHAWYDQVLFPDTSPMADPEARAGE
jgi:hypothetical protein